MTKEKIERTTIHYIIGGSVPMMLLLPLLIECVNKGYQSMTGKTLSRFEGTLLSSLSFFVLFTIIFTVGLKKCIKNKEKELGCSFALYYLYSAIYLLGSTYFICTLFQLPTLLCIILPILFSLLSLSFYKYSIKKLSK